ncbi:MAG: redoxin domain-containing protein [Candidatus Eremiobacteraeota bacterium]|nr:redoxin domain-containing protein [Candidatus Eremiobacteraeota bacterium]
MNYPLALASAALLAVSLSAPASVLAQAAPAPLTGPQVGKPAPDFVLKTLDGKTVRLSDYRGKTLVVNVWATWCPPCRQEMPDLLSSYASLRSQKVAFLGVDTTEEAPIIRAYVVAKNVPYAQAVDTTKTFQKAYDVQYFPTTYVVDENGILRARYIDVIAPRQLSQLVAAAKAGRNGEIVSPLQAKVDAVLTDSTIAFDGDAAAALAGAKKADAAIAKAEGMLDGSDAAAGNPTDLLRTRAEEAALRDRAIVALARSASSDDDKVLLARMRGDAAKDRERWNDALTAYGEALALAPKNDDALSGVAFVAGRLNRYDIAIDADKKLAALKPDSVDALVELALAYAKAKRFQEAYATFDEATASGKRAVDAELGSASKVRKLAWAYLYEGRTYAKGGDRVRARKAFDQLLAWSQKLPKNDVRHDMYLEEGQEAIVALELSKRVTTTSISLAPWTGADLPGSIPNTIKYRLVVADQAGKTVALTTSGVAKGWIASFCSDRVCSPFKTSLIIPASGVKIVEFQLVPPDGNTKPSGPVRVTGNDGTHVSSATT